MKYLISILLLLAVACSTPNDPAPSKPSPSKPDVVKPEPTKPVKKSCKAMGCHYIRNKEGKPLEPKVALTLKQHCNLQLQGSGFVDGQMYGYWTKNSLHKLNCSSISSKISGTVKFIKDKNPYGTGVKLWALTPFKSIAVDPKYIPYGSDVFIPELEGRQYKFEGRLRIHDGWVKAQDTGGAIKGNHIDFFIGPYDGTWSDRYKFIAEHFPFVKSKSSARFTAYVTNKERGIKKKRMRLWSTFYYLPEYKSCECE